MPHSISIACGALAASAAPAVRLDFAVIVRVVLLLELSQKHSARRASWVKPDQDGVHARNELRLARYGGVSIELCDGVHPSLGRRGAAGDAYSSVGDALEEGVLLSRRSRPGRQKHSGGLGDQGAANF